MEKVLESKKVPISGALSFMHNGKKVYLEVEKEINGIWIIVYLFENKKMVLKKKVFVELSTLPKPD